MENTTAMPTALQDQAKELNALREKQLERFESVKSVSGKSADEIAALKADCQAGITEIEAKATAFEEAQTLWQQEQATREAIKSMNQVVRKYPFSGGGQTVGGDPNAYQGERSNDGASVKTIGQLVTENPAYLHGIAGIKSAPFNIELKGADPANASIKTNMTEAAGWAPYGPRLPGYVPIPLRQPVFADLIPQESTESPLFFYMEETTHTNNAAYVAEGGVKPESAYVLTSRTVTASKIAVTIPASEELLEDIPQARSYIDQSLSYDLSIAEENGLLNFTSGANGWDGFLQKAGVQTQAKGADPAPTAVLKAMTLVQYSPGFAGMPTGLAMNPVDWQNIISLQATTGFYIWSTPSSPVEMPDMKMWGMTLRPTPALTAGTALLGNFQRFSKIWRRTGVNIRVAWINDDATRNLVHIICEERLALVISRGSAFAKITGL